MNAQQTWKLSQFFFPPPPQTRFAADAIREALSAAGVYFFYQGLTCVYVGESLDVRIRLGSHEQMDGIDAIGVIYCDASQRKRLESFYIGLLNPERNDQSTIRTRDRDKSRRRKNAPKGSLVRRFIQHIKQHPGSTSSDVLRKDRRLNSRRRREMIDFLVRWGVIEAVSERTAGRSKLVIYPITSRVAS